jgi:two-component SAPR family response regulator
MKELNMFTRNAMKEIIQNKVDLSFENMEMVLDFAELTWSEKNHPPMIIIIEGVKAL